MIKSLLKIIGGTVLCAVGLHASAQFQTEPKIVKPAKTSRANAALPSDQVAKAPVNQNIVYAPTSEVTRKFVYAVTFSDMGDNFEAANFLLQQGADINCQACVDTIMHSNSGRTILMREAGKTTRNGEANKLLAWLVNNGANVRIKDAAGNTVLHHVFTPWDDGTYFPGTRGNLRYVLSLGIDPKIKNEDGNTVLHIFAKNANLHIINNVNGEISDYASVIDELISAGANVDEKNIAGRTPLMESLKKCSLPIVRAWLQRGASAVVKDAAGQSLLDISRANAIQTTRKNCIEVATFFSNPQNIKQTNPISDSAVSAVTSTTSTPTLDVKFPAALVTDFHGIVKSSSQAQPIGAKGKIDENGHFEYIGENGVVMSGSFDASGPQLKGQGITRLPNVGDQKLTYPNGETEAIVVSL